MLLLYRDRVIVPKNNIRERPSKATLFILNFPTGMNHMLKFTRSKTIKIVCPGLLHRLLRSHFAKLLFLSKIAPVDLNMQTKIQNFRFFPCVFRIGIKLARNLPVLCQFGTCFPVLKWFASRAAQFIQ